MELLARKELKRLLKLCTAKQRDTFRRMYNSVEDVQRERLDWALKQCENTIVKNIEKSLVKRTIRDVKQFFGFKPRYKKDITEII